MVAGYPCFVVPTPTFFQEECDGIGEVSHQLGPWLSVMSVIEPERHCLGIKSSEVKSLWLFITPRAQNTQDICIYWEFITEFFPVALLTIYDYQDGNVLLCKKHEFEFHQKNNSSALRLEPKEPRNVARKLPHSCSTTRCGCRATHSKLASVSHSQQHAEVICLWWLMVTMWLMTGVRYSFQ